MIDQGHIKVKVGDTEYPLAVDPFSYQEVDITDFSPRAIGTNIALGELGLYTDAGQDDWGHGIGEWDYDEPQSYAYSGHLVDTRHGFIQLFNNPTSVTVLPSGYEIKKVLRHRGKTVIMGVKASTSDTLIGVLDSAGDTLDGYREDNYFVANDMMDVGNYLIMTGDGRMQVCDVATATSGGASTITLTGAGWDANIFTGAEIKIVYGTGAGQGRTVAGNTSDTITNTAPWGTNPDSTSVFVVDGATGSATNNPDNFGKLGRFGGYYWSYEVGTNYLHFWAESSGSDAEGQGSADIAYTQVGPPGTPIVNLVGYDNLLYVFREDGVWTIQAMADDTLAYQSGLMFEGEQSSLNFQDTVVWQGFLIFPIRNRIYKYKTGLQDITPPRWNDEFPYKQHGNWVGFITRGNFLYIAGQSNAANADETLETSSGFVSMFATDGVGWHKILDFDRASPDSYGMWLDQANDRLYVSTYKSSTSVLQFVQLETLSDLPYAVYPTSGNHNWYSSFYAFSLPRIPKSFASITIGGDFPTGTDVDVYYRLDDTTTWTLLGTADTDMEELEFAAGVTGKKIQMKLNLQTSASGYTPVIKKLIVKLMLRPDVLYGVTCNVIVADNISTPNRTMLGMTSKEIRAALKAARDSVEPITFTDLFGDSAEAYLSSCRFITVAYEDVDAVQAQARCTFVYV